MTTSMSKDGLVTIPLNASDAYHMGYAQGYADGRSAAPRWVRCEDDKPKERDYYFAFTADAEVFVGEYIPSVDQWWNGDDLILTVTHWMPIEPPKEE